MLLVLELPLMQRRELKYIRGINEGLEKQLPLMQRRELKLCCIQRKMSGIVLPLMQRRELKSVCASEDRQKYGVASHAEA